MEFKSYVTGILVALCANIMFTAGAANLQLYSISLAEAEHALLQGDTDLAAKFLSATKDKNEPVLKLQILLLLALGEIDEAETKLVALEKKYALSPQTFAFSAEVWRSIGHQVNIFSKRSRYQKAVAAKIKAGNLAPESAKYLTLKASALGQSRDYGGVDGEQQKVTETILALDPKWGAIASINLAQNTESGDKGEMIVKRAIEQFPDDFFILERVAQYFWTNKQYSNAQQYFYQACQHNPTEDWHTQVRWFNSCYLTAHFAQDKGLGIEWGINALETLLKTYPLPTKENFEVAQLLFDLDHRKVSEHAKLFFEAFIVKANDRKLVKKAKNNLKHY